MMDDATAFAQWKAQRIKDALPDCNRPGIRILDYGCGDGLMTYYLQEVFFQASVYGYDKFYNCSIAYDHEIPLLSEQESTHQKFDVIILSFVLHHLDHAEQAALIEELSKQLSPDGALVILDFNRFAPQFWFGNKHTVCGEFKDFFFWPQLRSYAYLKTACSFPSTHHYWGQGLFNKIPLSAIVLCLVKKLRVENIEIFVNISICEFFNFFQRNKQ